MYEICIIFVSFLHSDLKNLNISTFAEFRHFLTFKFAILVSSCCFQLFRSQIRNQRPPKHQYTNFCVNQMIFDILASFSGFWTTVRRGEYKAGSLGPGSRIIVRHDPVRCILPPGASGSVGPWRIYQRLCRIGVVGFALPA